MTEQHTLVSVSLRLMEGVPLVDKYMWLLFVGLAGLAWGTYVPIIFYGGSELTAKPGELGGRLMAILCVGLAYFVLGVLVPLALFLSGQHAWPEMKPTGLIFASLAGVAGAIGAICVIFASKAAVDAAKSAGLPPATYRMYIAPLIFGLAPLINTLISIIWHPRSGDAFNFGIEQMPSGKLLIGILFVGIGSFLVLFSKEESEAHAHQPSAPAAVTAPGESPPR